MLALDGGTVPWHRVVRADGSCAPHLVVEQRRLLRAEGVVFDGIRVRLAEFRRDSGRTAEDKRRAPG